MNGTGSEGFRSRSLMWPGLYLPPHFEVSLGTPVLVFGDGVEAFCADRMAA